MKRTVPIHQWTLGWILALIAVQPALSVAQDSQVDDPFGGSNMALQPDARTRRLAGIPDRELKGEISQLQEEVKLNMGSVTTISSYLLSINLTNKFGAPLVFDKVTSSCGCLSGFPENVKFVGETPLETRVAFKAPPTNGEFEKTITLFDTQSSARTVIVLQGEAHSVIELEQPSFSVKKTGKTSFETNVRFPMEQFDPNFFRLSTAYERLVGWRLLVNPDKKTGKLVFDAITTPENFSQMLRFSVTDLISGKPCGEVEVYLRLYDRPIARPETIMLKEDHRGKLVGRVAVQMDGLSEAGPKATMRTLVGSAISKEDASTFTFDISAKLAGGGGPVSVAILEVTDPRILEQRNAFDLSVEFVGKEDSLSVPMIVVKGE